MIKKRIFNISQPKGLEIFEKPTFININWEANNKVKKFALYYSKFNINKSSEWILTNDNINRNLTEYSWNIPSVYTNEVKLKIVSVITDSSTFEGLSHTVFTIYDSDVLAEDQQYQKKLEIGNKWVYYITKDFVWYDDKEYYLVEEVIEKK